MQNEHLVDHPALDGNPSATQSPPAASTSRHQFLLAFLLTFSLITSAVAFWPAFKATIEDSASSEGRAHRAKPFYRAPSFKLCLVWVPVALVLFVREWPNPRGRIKRTTALLGMGVYQCALAIVYTQLVAERPVVLPGVPEFGTVSESQWSDVPALRIIEAQYEPAPAAIEALRARSDIATFADLHRAVMESYIHEESRLRQTIPGAAHRNEKTLKTLFIMNLVSGLWSYGNQTAIDKPGGVFGNELNGWKSPPANVRSYLDSKIGCCTDHAHLTKFLLDHEGIECRLTSITGHIFNEVRLDGHWCVVDATANIFVDMPWDEIYGGKHSPDSIAVILFPHTNLTTTDPSRYRSAIGQIRMMTLSRIASRPAHLAKTEHPGLPPYLSSGSPAAARLP